MTADGDEPVVPAKFVTSGVPLGGLGAGAVELGQDGRFRNITINNNRTADARIPVSASSFLALRIEGERGVYARILQQELTPQLEMTEPPRLRTNQYEWRGLYPRSDFRLTDPKCPAEVLWSGLAPIIPFDIEASTLPAMFVRIKLKNTSAEALDFAVVMNWENLVGRTQSEQPGKLPSVRPKIVRQEDNAAAAHAAEAETEAAPHGLDEPNALRFGPSRSNRANAAGEHCLAVRPHEGTSISLLVWNSDHLGDWRAFWNQFRNLGALGGTRLRSGTPKSGAVCSTFRLAPGEEFSVDFALTWHCPRFQVAGRDQGNAYANRFANSIEVAREALKHLDYYSTSVDGWQRRLLLSTLPRSLINALINSCHILSSNSIYTREGHFGLMESPQDPRVGCLDMRFYHTLVTLLFFPRLETSEVQLHMEAEAEHELALNLHLGSQCLHQPEPPKTDAQRLNLCIHLVLSAHRNYLLTGTLVRLQELFGHLQDYMNWACTLDRNQDGLPDITAAQSWDGHDVPGLTSHTASLWVAAAHAYADIAKRLRKRPEQDRFTAIAHQAAASFERLYWNEECKHYRFYVPAKNANPGEIPPDACNSGQLAGQWAADVLHLGTLFSESHIREALEAVRETLEREFGLASTALPAATSPPKQTAAAAGRLESAWPAYTMSHCDSLGFAHGDRITASRMLEKHLQSQRQRRDLLFEQPLEWDPNTNDALPGTLKKHCSGLAVWHVLFAMQGFLYDAPRQMLIVRPRPPENSTTLSTPLFTPFCLGWMRYQEETTPDYIQRVNLSFDSPLMVKTFVLQVPPSAPKLYVRFLLAETPVEFEQELKRESDHTRLLIKPKRLLSITGTLALKIATRAAAVAVKKPRRLYE